MIFITGGAGFTGSNMSRYFLEKGEDVCIFDNLTTGSYDNIPRGVTFQQGDIAEHNMNDLLLHEKPETVINLAAISSVGECIKFPREAEHVNVRGVERLLKACVKAGVKNFVQASSAAVYAEDHTKYGATKVSAEWIVNQYKNKLNTINCRFFNVYGDYQTGGVIPAFLKGGDVINGGAQTRDFIHVLDLCRAVDAIIRNIENISWNHIDIGTGIETSINSLSYLIDPERRTYNEPMVEGEILRSCADVKALEGIGWNKRMGLWEGIERTRRWINEN